MGKYLSFYECMVCLLNVCIYVKKLLYPFNIFFKQKVKEAYIMSILFIDYTPLNMLYYKG